MKKWITMFVVVMMVAVLSAGTMASTIGVGVTPGFAIDLNKQLTPQSDPISLTGYYGVNEQLLFRLGYTNSDPSVIQIGGRYVIMKNLAATLDYYTATEYYKINAGLRYRYNATKKLDIAGVLDYSTDKDSNSGLNLLAQAEYKLGEVATLNGGYSIYTQDGVSSGNVVIGGEYYLDKHWCPYVDYYISTDAGGTNYLYAGIYYQF